MGNVKRLFIFLFVLLFSMNSVFSELIEISPESEQLDFLGGQSNFRGIQVLMKTDAFLWSVKVADGSNCGLVRIINDSGIVISESIINTDTNIAQFDDLRLLNGSNYSILAGPRYYSGLCDMRFKSSPSYPYIFDDLNILKGINGLIVDEDSFVMITSLLIQPTVSEEEVVDYSNIDGQTKITSLEVRVIGDFVSFDVQDYVSLGNVSRGFSTDPERINITNSGNTDILLGIDNRANEVLFDNLYFSRRISGEDKSFKKPEDFNLIIEKPSSLGGSRDDYFYVKLDLSNYKGSIPLGSNSLDADIKFIAFPI